MINMTSRPSRARELKLDGVPVIGTPLQVAPLAGA